MIKKFAKIFLVATVFLVVQSVFAQSIRIYTGSPLTQGQSKDSGHVFTMADALNMSTYHMKTTTNWTSMSDFKGVRLGDVLDKYHLIGTKLYFRCFDGYSYEIPVSDLRRYNVILAYERDGARMSIKTLGPFALIYPRSAFPKELGGPETDPKFIWMIKDIFVE